MKGSAHCYWCYFTTATTRFFSHRSSLSAMTSRSTRGDASGGLRPGEARLCLTISRTFVVRLLSRRSCPLRPIRMAASLLSARSWNVPSSIFSITGGVGATHTWRGLTGARWQRLHKAMASTFQHAVSPVPSLLLQAMSSTARRVHRADTPPECRPPEGLFFLVLDASSPGRKKGKGSHCR